MDRVSFLESVDGIQYPEMIVNFFDYFIAIKQMVEDTGSVRVEKCESPNGPIIFVIRFGTVEDVKYSIAKINSTGGSIIIYGRPISINVEVLTDLEIKISLQ